MMNEGPEGERSVTQSTVKVGKCGSYFASGFGNDASYM